MASSANRWKSNNLEHLWKSLRTVAPTIGKTLGLSALAGLASEGASQLVKEMTGGQVFQVQNKELFRLAMMSDLLNKGQIRG